MLGEIIIFLLLLLATALSVFLLYKKTKRRFQRKTKRIVAYNDRLERQRNALFKLGTHNDLYRGDIYSSIMKLCEITSEALGASSVSFWYYDEQKHKLCCYEEFFKRKHWGRMPIDLRTEKELLKKLQHSRMGTSSHEDDRNLFAALMNDDSESLLYCTIFLEEGFRGVFCIERREVSEWTADEKAFAASLLDVLVTALLIYDRKVLEDELFLQSAAVSSTLEGIAIIDSSGTILFANKAYGNMHGYASSTELKNVKIQDFYKEADYQRFKKELLPLLSRRGKITVDTFGKKRHGAVYPQELSLSVINKDRYVLVARDITIRKRVEQKAQEHALFSTLSPSPILRTDKSGLITLANPAAVKIFGVDQQKNIEDVLPGLSREVISRCIDEGSTSTITLQRDRHRFILTLTGLSELQIAHIYAKDITELQVTENKLKESEQFLRTILDAAPSAIFVKDREGRYTLANQTTAKIFGVSVNEVVGRTDFDLCAVETQAERFRKDDQRTLYENREISIRREFLTDRDGKRHVFQTVKRPLALGTDGEVTHILGVGADITESVELQDRLGQSLKMDAIGQLAGGIAHDFNNLLTGILGYAEVLKDRTISSEEVLKAAEKIEHISMRATDLTEKLLGFARKGKHKNVTITLQPLIEETIEICRRTFDRRILIQNEADDTNIHLKGDPTQIQQVLLNLILNARDAIRSLEPEVQAGKIVIRTESILIEHGNSLQNSQLAPGRYVQLSVLDTGSGIPENIKDKIFEPFFTTKEAGKGTGMGLSMVYGIVANHGGSISLEPDEKYNTKFTVYLPELELSEKETPLQPPVVAQPAGGNGCILLVDDHYIVRDVTAKMLASLGYKVLTASDGVEAVNFYKEHNGEIDLIILDMVMPRMSAKECFRMIRGINPHVRVILSTGYAHNNIVQEVMDEGMVGFVQKPFQMNSLSQVVSEALQH